MTIQSFDFPPPENEADFESLCLAVFQDHLSAPELQKFARRGQRQLGVDLVGRDGKGELCGIQCKLRAARQRLTKREVKEEVDKATQFTPRLNKYIIATTARRDPNIQALAAQLTQSHTERCLFSVQVYAWEDIKEILKRNLALVRVFYGAGETTTVSIAAESVVRRSQLIRSHGTYRLVTLVNGKSFREGTAWLFAERRVVTAFAIVGDPASANWFRDSEACFSYWLDVGGPARCRLSPLGKDPEADLAVLEILGSQTAGSPLRVTQREFVRRGTRWWTEGFPSGQEFKRQAFVLEGTVAQYAPGRLCRQLQLHVQQGAHISWEGMAGSPVVIDGEVVGVLTDALPGASTFWATSISLHHPVLARPMGILLSGSGEPEQKQAHSDVSNRAHLRARGQLQVSEFDYLLALINTGDDGLRKNALQDLCTAAEIGFLPNEDQRAALLRSLEPLWRYSSYKTRNWLVKVVGVSRLHAFGGHLRRVFFEDQEDEESKSWALAAYSKLVGSDLAIDLMRSSDHVGTTYRMAIQFYADRDLRLLDRLEVARCIEENEVAAKWLALLYGYDHRASPSLTGGRDSGILSALTSHENDSVAEHALWALHRAKRADSAQSSFSLETLLSRAPNVRRRGYLLACKHEASYTKSAESLRARIHSEGDVYAREGLALGLAPIRRYREHLAEEIGEWYEREEAEQVRLALLPHITTFCDRNREYEMIVRGVLSSDSPDALTRRRIRSVASFLPSNHSARTLTQEYSMKAARDEIIRRH